jgi:cyclase
MTAAQFHMVELAIPNGRDALPGALQYNGPSFYSVVMKNNLLLLLSACLLGFASPAKAQSLPPLVRQAAPGVFYRLSEDDKRIIATTSWIELKDFVVVIDANFPWGARALLADLRKTTPKPIRFVLDTHHHGDHSYGNGVFAQEGATIVASDDTAADSLARNAPGWAKDTGTGDYDLKKYTLVHPQLTFRDKLVLDDGERRLEFLRVGPGHTRGDVVAWLPKERIVFTGDLCTTRAQNNFGDPGMDPHGWVRILEKLADMNPAVVIPGHGTQGTVDSLKGQEAYISAIINHVEAGIAQQSSPDQIFSTIDFSKYKPWSDNDNRNHAAAAAIYQKLKTTTN